MIQIIVNDVSGQTYPVQVYVSDIYSNNQIFLGSITGASQLPSEYILSNSSIFENSPQINLILQDVDCVKTSLVTCTII